MHVRDASCMHAQMWDVQYSTPFQNVSCFSFISVLTKIYMKKYIDIKDTK
jgi:hypothetical protein